MTLQPDPILARQQAAAETSAEMALVAATKARVEAFPSIQTPQQFEAATQLAKLIKQRHAYLDNQRKVRVGPLTDVVRLLNADYRPPMAAYESFEARLKSLMAAYVQAQRALQVSAMVQQVAVPIPALETVTGVRMTAKRRARIVDADKVPRQFCSPDIAKIQAHIDNGGLEAIAGIEFYDETSVVIHKDR